MTFAAMQYRYDLRQFTLLSSNHLGFLTAQWLLRSWHIVLLLVVEVGCVCMYERESRISLSFQFFLTSFVR
jgi:hypothetical protein